jgi:SAM-dependent methyltransferase
LGKARAGQEVSVSYNQTNTYDVDPHIAEIYDQIETYRDDVELIRRLIRERRTLRILEPFCGTGRILIPLALEGHTLVGLDQSIGMLERAREKVSQLPQAIQQNIALTRTDVTDAQWPNEFDLVILGSNCFYELATPEEQERCIALAAESLKPGGYVYVDNNHMEGELDEDWQELGVVKQTLSGTCLDGTEVEGTLETIWCDVPGRLARFRRRVVVTRPDGRIVKREYIQQKHPVSIAEVQAWLERHGFTVERLYGDRAGNPYTRRSKRAIFWAKKHQ